MSRVRTHFNGRVSTDPKEYGEGSKRRLFFNVAANTTITNEDGTKDQVTEFVPCIVWGPKRVDALKPWLLKGRLIGVEGSFRSHEVRDDNGEFVKKDWVCRVSDLEFLDKKPEGVEAPSTGASTGDIQSQILAAMQQLIGQAKEGDGVPY